MSHKCKNGLVTCMDFRLYPEVFSWMERENILGDSDFLGTPAGASMCLLNNKSPEAKMLINQIEASIKLHNLETVILLHHSQCGAYGLAYNFSTSEEEKAKQFEDMNNSRKIILDKFPQLKVRLVWAELLDDCGKKIIFEDVE